MVNPNFDPTEKEEDILEVMKQENRANPYLLREQTGLGKGDVNTALTRLTSAGWVRKVTRGLYEYVDDPRSDSENEQSISPKVEEESASPLEQPTGVNVDAVDDALEGWNPGQGAEDTRKRRESGKQVLYWLRDHGESVSRSDVIAALYEQAHLSGQKEDSWYRKVAKPALNHAGKRGYVDTSARSYEWVGE